MPIRWYLFAVANYIFLFVYVLFFLGALRFTAEILPADEISGFFTIFMISLGITILNSAFNLYIFHGYLPGRSPSRKIKTVYLISTVLFTASLIVVTINLTQTIIIEDINEDEADFKNFLKWIIVLNTIPGIFILIHQFVIRRFIEKNSKTTGKLKDSSP